VCAGSALVWLVPEQSVADRLGDLIPHLMELPFENRHALPNDEIQELRIHVEVIAAALQSRPVAELGDR